jgi:hypothetical protein
MSTAYQEDISSNVLRRMKEGIHQCPGQRA